MLSLAKPVAERVARHLVATGQLIDEDAELALEHALAARRLAARIAVVREAVGLAAYRAGEWQTALAELRTYHRMTGKQTHLAVLADCERALGRPERAIDLFRGADRESLDKADAIELLIVAAGARGDMGQGDAAVAMLQVRELTSASAEPWAARLRYAYADSLLAVNRREEAREWFARAADADEYGETDAAERLLELDGVVIEGDDLDEDEDDVDLEKTESEADLDDEADSYDAGTAADTDEDLDDEDLEDDDEDLDDGDEDEVDPEDNADDFDDEDLDDEDDEDDEDDDEAVLGGDVDVPAGDGVSTESAGGLGSDSPERSNAGEPAATASLPVDVSTDGQSVRTEAVSGDDGLSPESTPVGPEGDASAGRRDADGDAAEDSPGSARS
ncbi:hypothetical protein V1633_35580 [Plantactinospora sonchi]|uniref:Replicase polyprotein 1ab n=1 Tax=Plantactinospora sonchi TaxID=1544735 RepID=A0ABU7S1M7_9ACTN